MTGSERTVEVGTEQIAFRLASHRGIPVVFGRARNSVWYLLAVGQEAESPLPDAQLRELWKRQPVAA